MKHDWIDTPATMAQVCSFGWEPMRTCRRCGAVQQRITQQNWGRVTGYRWEPLVGRCTVAKAVAVQMTKDFIAKAEEQLLNGDGK